MTVEREREASTYLYGHDHDCSFVLDVSRLSRMREMVHTDAQTAYGWKIYPVRISDSHSSSLSQGIQGIVPILEKGHRVLNKTKLV